MSRRSAITSRSSSANYHVAWAPLPTTVEAQVQALTLPQLEALGEALLDFAELDDLTDWMRGQ
jgi:Domain of unknown function (DUF4351)